MTKIKLLIAFKADHHSLPEGMVIAVPSEVATRFIKLGMAEQVAPEPYQTAVIEPQEKRVYRKRNYGS